MGVCGTTKGWPPDLASGSAVACPAGYVRGTYASVDAAVSGWMPSYVPHAYITGRHALHYCTVYRHYTTLDYSVYITLLLSKSLDVRYPRATPYGHMWLVDGRTTRVCASLPRSPLIRTYTVNFCVPVLFGQDHSRPDQTKLNQPSPIHSEPNTSFSFRFALVCKQY